MIKVTEPITFAEGFDEKHYKNSIHVFLLYHDENMRMDEITSFTVSNFFCQLQNRGVEKTSIHLLRHTFAVNWIRQSGDIVKLQHMLTHSDLKTTQIYLDLVYDDLAQNMEEVNPLEKLKKQSEKIPGEKF